MLRKLVKKYKHPKTMPAIPFTSSYNPSVEGIILDYLHPDQLDKFSKSTTEDFVTQAFVQVPAKNKVDASYQLLIENLKLVVLTFTPWHKMYESIYDENIQQKYSSMCARAQSLLLKVIKEFDFQTASHEKRSLIKDCVMHFCYQNEKAKTLLDEMLQSVKFTDVINCFIGQYEFNFYDLGNMILFKFPFDTIRRISESTPREFSWGMERCLAFAAFHPDPNVLHFLVGYLKEYVGDAFNFLLRMNEDYKAKSIENIDLGLWREHFQKQISLEFCEDALERFLKAARHSKLNETDLTCYLLAQTKKTLTVEQYKQLYTNYVTLSSLNHETSEGFFKKLTYKNVKLRFIESIQIRMCEAFVSADLLNKYVKSNTISVYRSDLAAVLAHPMFSKEHEYNGVKPQFRKKLKRRLEEVDETFRLQPSKLGLT